MKSRLTRSFLLVSFCFAADKIVALVRQSLVARAFGAGSELDAFNSANNLPDLVFAVISGGAMAMVVIPVLTEALDREGRDRMWLLFSRLANWAFLITAVLAVLLAVFAEPLVDHVVVPYFSTAQKAVTTRLLRMDLIALLIFSISGLVIGSLQAQKHFLFPALAPIFYNVGQIIGVFVLVPALGIYGLALGVILGAILHLLIQVPALVTHGFRWSPSLDLRSPGLRKAAALMGPRILTVAVIQAIFVYTDRTASGMVAGSITALTYGWLILQVPETLIGSALGTVLLPTFSELADRGSLEDLRRMVRRAFLVLLGLTLPVVALGVPMMETAVRLVFEGRAFTPEDTGMVTATARLLLLGLPAHAWIETAVRVLYSRLDARTPLWAAAATTALFILLCILFSPALQYRGVALANTLSFSMEALLLLGWLRLRRLI